MLASGRQLQATFASYAAKDQIGSRLQLDRQDWPVVVRQFGGGYRRCRAPYQMRATLPNNVYVGAPPAVTVHDSATGGSHSSLSSLNRSKLCATVSDSSTHSTF
jgi:hypothetical protein